MLTFFADDYSSLHRGNKKIKLMAFFIFILKKNTMVDFMSTNYLSQIIDTPGIRFVQSIKRRICIQFLKISTSRVR